MPRNQVGKVQLLPFAVQRLFPGLPFTAPARSIIRLISEDTAFLAIFMISGRTYYRPSNNAHYHSDIQSTARSTTESFSTNWTKRKSLRINFQAIWIHPTWTTKLAQSHRPPFSSALLTLKSACRRRLSPFPFHLHVFKTTRRQRAQVFSAQGRERSTLLPLQKKF